MKNQFPPNLNVQVGSSTTTCHVKLFHLEPALHIYYI